jgi:hypothetical protein
MEKIRIIKINLKRVYQQVAIPQNWLRQYFPEGGVIELYQDKDRLILTPKKVKEKAGCK